MEFHASNYFEDNQERGIPPTPYPLYSAYVPQHKQTAYEEKKDKMSSMNWGNLGKSGGGGKRGGGAGGRRGAGSSYGSGAAGGATAEQAAGLDAAWKERFLPKEGDELKCKHFKACAGCEFDRRFDETPIMVDSRCDKWERRTVVVRRC